MITPTLIYRYSVELYVPCVVFLGWLVDNQMWGRAAMLVEEMGDEWGRVSFRLDREFPSHDTRCCGV